MTVPQDRLVTATQAAERLGVTRQAVAKARASHDDFPPPVAQYGRTLVFDWQAVEAWYRSKGGPRTKPAQQ